MSGFFYTFIAAKTNPMKSSECFRFVVLAGLLFLSAGLSAQVNIPAKKSWTASGIMVSSGDRIVIHAEGTITLDPNVSCTPEGLKIVSGPEHVLLKGFNRGGLVCRVGKKGAPFYVGAGITVNIGTGGELFFGVNDDKVKNNSGTYRVQVTVN